MSVGFLVEGSLDGSHADRVTRGQQQLLSGPMTRRLGDPDAACRDCAVGSGKWEFDTKAGERDVDRSVWEPCCFGFFSSLPLRRVMGSDPFLCAESLG